MQWPGQAAFNSAPNVTWHANSSSGALPSGSAVSAQGLTFLRVARAGHMVPKDEPQAALDMVTRFLHNQTFGGLAL